MVERCSHRPVLLDETIHFLNPSPGKVILDATIGGGGHAEKILGKLMPGGKLIGMDRDAQSLKIARERLRTWQDSLILINRNFREIKSALSNTGIGEVDGILFDLGISSIQMETGERGFSIKNPGPLDMRMDRDQTLTAKDIVNRLSESELSKLIRDFGEERFSKRIARQIVAVRNKAPIETTAELAEIVSRSMPHGRRWTKIQPATRTFQALRIAVNDELEAIEAVLNDVPGILKKGGRLCIISFHSLEDRIVKNIFRRFESQAIFRILTKKPVTAKEKERLQNPRSRSAKLRAGEKLA